MAKKTALRPDIQVSADPTVTRIIPELAAEIGLNESIMLLQIAYWIKITNGKHYIDGNFWTYQSSQDMRDKAFGYWSISTINRTAKSLEDKGLIIVGNYNTTKYDRTKWFALNVDTLRELKSVSIAMVEQTLCQNDKRQNQNDKRQNQDDKPIPETTTENTTEKKTLSASADDAPPTDAEQPEPTPKRVSISDVSLSWDAFVTDLTKAFGCHAEARNVANMLLGRSKKKPYSEYNFDVGLSPVQMHQAVICFPAWYALETDGLAPPRKVMAIVDYMHQFLQDGKEWRAANGAAILRQSHFYALYPMLDDSPAREPETPQREPVVLTPEQRAAMIDEISQMTGVLQSPG